MSQVFFQKFYTSSSTTFGAQSVYQTADGGYMVAASNLWYHSYDHPALIKFDSLGNKVWDVTYSSNYSFAPLTTSIQTSDSGYLFAGYASDNLYQIAIIKTDRGGNQLWANTYGCAYDLYGYGVAQTFDGGYIISATMLDNGIKMGTLLIKIDAAGNVLWNRHFDNFMFSEVLQAADSGYVVSGHNYFSGSYVYTLTKTNSNGNYQWYKSYDGAFSTGTAEMFCQTHDHGFILASHCDTLGAGLGDIVLIKTDSAGSVIWSKAYGGGNRDFPALIKELPDGGFIVSGKTRSFGLTYDVYLLRTDNTGHLLWSKTYGDAGHNEGCGDGNNVFLTADSGYVIAATSDTISGSTPMPKILLIKTDANGFSGCQESNPATIETTVSLQGHSGILSEDSITLSAHALPLTILYAGISVTICESVGIEELKSSSPLTIYPSPTNRNVTIDIGQDAIDVVQIYNSLGKKLSNFTYSTGKSETEIELSNLPAGIYLVRATAGEKVWRGKVVKE